MFKSRPSENTYSNDIEIRQFTLEFDHRGSKSDFVVANNLGPAGQHALCAPISLAIGSPERVSYIPEPELDGGRLGHQASRVSKSSGSFGEDGSTSESNPVGKSVAIPFDIRHHRP